MRWPRRGAELAEECCKIAVLETRDFTAEEIDAVRWKLKMHKSTARSIARFMSTLSAQAISRLVVRHKFVVAEPPAPKEGVH